jgi:hypothetical protein
MKTATANQITKYIIDNINYTSPSTYDKYIIYWNKDKEKINHTSGSMRCYDDNHEKIIVIEFLNEYAPYTKKHVRQMVDYCLEEMKKFIKWQDANTH